MLAALIVLAFASAHAQTPGALGGSEQRAPAPGASVSGPAAMFAAADTDKDGVVSRAEWIEAGRNEGRYARFDADADGKLTWDEVAAALGPAPSSVPGAAAAPTNAASDPR